MKGFVSPTHYVFNQCTYCLTLSNPKQLRLEAQDNITHMTTTLYITSSMLQQYHLTIEQFTNQIYMQIIHEGLHKKYLLKHEHNIIYFHFNFPKCMVSDVRFPCQWVTLHKLTEQKERIAAFFEKLLSSTVSKFQKLIGEKLKNALKQLEERLDKMLKKYNNDADQKILQFDAISHQIKAQLYQNSQKQLERLKNTLINSNFRYFDEFRVIKEELQASISICDSKIKQTAQNVDSLIVVMNDQEGRIEQLQKNVSLTLKSFNTRTSLDKREQTNSDIVWSFQEPHSPQPTKKQKKRHTPTKSKSWEKSNQAEQPGNDLLKSQ